MRLLLDTHALLWWLADDAQLGVQARGLIADPGNDILVSVASLWEIVVKSRVGKLRADFREISWAIDRDGFSNLPVSDAHLAALEKLPVHHRDPFDHLLIAQAMAEDVTFLSGDGNASKYPVRVVDCAM